MSIKKQKSQKEHDALNFLRQYVTAESKPIVFWSSGKDSMVCLHLTLRLKRVPVMWWRLPKFQDKQIHGNWVARLWNLEMYDMTPSVVQEYQHDGFFEVFHGYRGFETGTMYMSTGIVPYKDDEPYLCAVEDLVLRPRGVSEFPWDVAIQGQKSCDESYVGQHTEIINPAQPFGNTVLLNPIHDWTDKDVWDYIRKYDLPIDRRRYQKQEQHTSPDHYPTCFRCLDTRERGNSVMCPKLGKLIPSMAKSEEEHQETREAIVGSAAHVRVDGPPRSTVGDHI